jgi:gamma-glutamylcyclotransferase (GGCT)/AIG2-like uncharacterized protein YtfP
MAAFESTRPTAFREPVTADDEVFYFGYGANMSAQSLAARGVKLLDPQGRPAVLRGHDLVFNVAPMSTTLLCTLEPAFGNVRASAKPDAHVHGVLHRVMGSAIQQLDTWEGAGYQRLSMAVHPYDEDEHVTAFVYIQTESFATTELKEKLPGERYLNILRSGAAISGLHPNWLEKLSAHPYLEFPRLELERDQLPVNPVPPTPTPEETEAILTNAKPYWTILDGVLIENVPNHPSTHPAIVKMLMCKDATAFVMSMVPYTDSLDEKMKFVKGLLQVMISHDTTTVSRVAGSSKQGNM